MVERVPRLIVNGIDLDALDGTLAAIAEDPSQARLRFRVHTTWTGQTRSESMVEGCRIGGSDVDRRFKIVADEPHELLGTNSAPNAQELMLAALNAGLVVSYVAQASALGVHLDDCRIETEGEFDLRGLGFESGAAPERRRIGYRVHLDGDATPEQFASLHESVAAIAGAWFAPDALVRL